MEKYIKGKEDSFYQSTQFYLKGSLYLSSWESKRSGGEVARRDTAYDGSTHQNFYRDERELVVEGKPRGTARQPYYVPPAALDPYEFALYDLGKPRSFDILNDEETWLSLSNSATIVGEEFVDGHSCVVIDIEVPGNQIGGLAVMSRVYFCKDFDFFPLLTEWFQLDSGYRFQRYRAWDIIKIANPEGDGIFVNRMGLSTSWNWSGSGEVSAGFLSETDLGTYEVNPELPDSMFTLPISQALVYDNRVDPSLSFSIPGNAEILNDLENTLADTRNSAPVKVSTALPAQAIVALPDESGLEKLIAHPVRTLWLLFMIVAGVLTIVLGCMRLAHLRKSKTSQFEE
jgi:hypothetical protein